MLNKIKLKLAKALLPNQTAIVTHKDIIRFIEAAEQLKTREQKLGNRNGVRKRNVQIQLATDIFFSIFQ